MLWKDVAHVLDGDGVVGADGLVTKVIQQVLDEDGALRNGAVCHAFRQYSGC